VGENVDPPSTYDPTVPLWMRGVSTVAIGLALFLVAAGIVWHGRTWLVPTLGVDFTMALVFLLVVASLTSILLGLGDVVYAIFRRVNDRRD
jgi:hypothetical protein